MTEPKADFKFRTGRYQGQTYEWVCQKNPSYISWVKENQPNMLKEKVTTVTNLKETPVESNKMTPNPNFENEGPEWYCLPYLQKVKELNKPDDEYNF